MYLNEKALTLEGAQAGVPAWQRNQVGDGLPGYVGYDEAETTILGQAWKVFYIDTSNDVTIDGFTITQNTDWCSK